ncbi:MAG: type VI secretion system baseplate subunit TssG [Sulfurimonas sp.]|nr:type VI secretion system baseplate subunit TssG [Sulfurimonas sp.]
MGSSFGQQKIDLKKQLFEQASKFTYIQAMRLLELDAKSKDDSKKKKIRVHPRLSLDFPKSDITDIKEVDDFIKLTVTFMGLYGESSPLPTFYTESLLDEELNDKSAMREFIDIFNMPIYKAYFEIWKKNRLGIRIDEFKDSKALDFLHLFSGMPKGELRDKYSDKYSLLRYAGLNMHYPRSAEALRVLICDIIRHDDVEIVQCIEQMADIPKTQLCSLGVNNSTLDDDLHLGSKIKDRMGKFRILVKELSMKNFNQLLPHTQKFKELRNMIGLYITQSLDWEMVLILKDAHSQPLLLGDNESRLGLNSWLGDEKKDKAPRTLVLNKHQYKDLKW